MRKKIAFSFFAACTLAASICMISAPVAHAGTVTSRSELQRLADKTITYSKSKEGSNYNKVTLSNTYTNTTVWFTTSELSTLEGSFKIKLNQSRDNAQTGITGFLTYLLLRDSEQIIKASNIYVLEKERAQAAFFDKLYKNFLYLLDHKSIADGVYTGNLTFETIGTYTTLNNKSYQIYRASNGRYWFNTSSKYSFTSRISLENFVESQNGLLYIAPNQRRYRIFKYSSLFYFHRDDSSVSKIGWNNIQETRYYIDRHNQPVQGCTIVAAWKCSE